MWLCREELGLEHPLKELQPTQTQQLLPNAGQESKSKSDSLWVPSHISPFQRHSWVGPRVPSQPISGLAPVDNHLSLTAYRENQVFLKVISTECLFYYTWYCKTILIYFSTPQWNHFNLFFTPLTLFVAVPTCSHRQCKNSTELNFLLRHFGDMEKFRRLFLPDFLPHIYIYLRLSCAVKK